MSSTSLDVDAMAVYRRLLGYALKYWPVLAAGMVGMVVFAGMNVGFTAAVKPLLDGSFVDRNPFIISIMPPLIIAMFFVRGLADFAHSYCMNWVAWQVIKTLRFEVFEHYLQAPAAYFDRSSAGVLLSRLTYNTEQVALSTTSVMTIVVRDSVTIVALVVWMFYLNWLLAIFVLVTGPAIGGLVRYVSAKFRKYSARIQHSMGDVTRVGEEAIVGQRVIKIFTGQEYEREKFEAVNDNNRRLHMRLVSTQAGNTNLVQLVGSVGLASVIYVATREDAALTVGTFTSFLATMLFLMDPLKRITQLNAPIQQGIAAGQNIFHLLDEPLEDDGGEAPLDNARGRVEFRGVSFAYGANDGAVLDDVSFTIEPGETVAIVGRSGSGKSTLVNLVPRFYDPQVGSVLVDDRDAREYRLLDLRRQVGLVSQEVVLFNDTIARNIAYGGLVEATRAQIEKAARAAHVMEFAEQLPEGLDNLVGDRGVLLSGGQRQRIAIARAILKNAPILILDEATSALDTESERHIQQALTHLMRDRTTLVIAHRLSTVEGADRIVVLDKGRLIESGTHSDLLAASGQYATLYRLQFSEPALELPGVSN